jgi:hypothetical protein
MIATIARTQARAGDGLAKARKQPNVDGFESDEGPTRRSGLIQPTRYLKRCSENLIAMPQNIKISSILLSLLLERYARENATRGALRGYSCRGERLKE